MEPQLPDELYRLFRDLLQQRSGLSYPEHKRDDLAHGLDLALKATPCRSLAELYTEAEANVSGEVWETVLAHLTIGETSFFRNRPQFDALRSHIFPELFRRREQFRGVRVWSAGCATGEEPYSVAMLLHDMVPDLHEWHLSILATDINPNFLIRAREALYGNWSFRDTPTDLKERYFVPEQGRWRLKHVYRAMVTFARLNLIESIYPSITNGTTALDVIMCRNVTIYFDEPTTRRIIDRFYRALAPGGWLLVGHAEPQASIYHQFEVYNFPNTVIYRKQLDAPLFAFDPVRDMYKSDIPPLPPFLQTKSNQQETDVPPQQQPPASPAPPPEQSATPAPDEPNSSLRFLVPSGAKPPAAKPAPEPARSSLIVPSRSSTPTRADNLWPKIKVQLAHGDKSGAEQLLNELLRSSPGDVEALMALGRICADRGEWACAQTHCESAIQHDPLLVDAHYLLAQVYEHNEQFDDALNEYRRVVFLNPRYLPGKIGMANIWRQTGHLEDARRVYRNILKQLSTLSPATTVPGTDGATASELTAFVTRQLQTL